MRMGMSTLFCRLKNPGDAMIMDMLTLKHLLHRKVILHEHAFFRKCCFEMEVANHPSDPSRFLSFTQTDQETGLRLLLDDIRLCLGLKDAVSVIERFDQIESKIRSIRSLPSPTSSR